MRKKAICIEIKSLPLGNITVRKENDISPRKDFSPIRLRVTNMGRRPKLVQLFRGPALPTPDRATTCKLLHPDMHYGVLCSMLERVQLRITKTYVTLIKGGEGQLHEPLSLLELGRSDQGIVFQEPPRFSEAGMRTTEEVYRLGPNRRLMYKIGPGTTVDLCFFVASGIVPSGMGRPVGEQEQEQ
jgi:hypothetical protein